MLTLPEARRNAAPPQQRVAASQMEVALYKLCLNPVQSARGKSLAYPLYPDALAMINAVAEAAGAPAAAELMRRPPEPVSSAALSSQRRQDCVSKSLFGARRWQTRPGHAATDTAVTAFKPGHLLQDKRVEPCQDSVPSCDWKGPHSG